MHDPTLRHKLPHVLAIVPAFFPSTIIDVVKPLLEMSKSGLIQFKVTMEFAFKPRDLDWPDLVVLCRNCDHLYSSILTEIYKRGLPYIYDVDDNFFEIPGDTELGKYYQEPGRLGLHACYMEGADLVRVYSQPMLERASSLNSKVKKIVAPVDWKLVESPEAHTDGAVKILYTTSRQQDPLAYIALPPLKRILETHPGQVDVYFWGYTPIEFDGMQGVHFIKFTRNYDSYLRQFSKSGFDIGMAPLLDTIFFRSKTNNKFREFGAGRVAGIYSDVDVYSQCVVDGETGLLVSNEPEAWYTALKRLVEDRELRAKIQNQAEVYCRKNYNQETFKEIWLEQIRGVLANGDSLKNGASDRTPGSANSQSKTLAQQHYQKFLAELYIPDLNKPPRDRLRIVRRIRKIRDFVKNTLGPFFQVGIIFSLLLHPRQNQKLIVRKYHTMLGRISFFFKVIYDWVRINTWLRGINWNDRWSIFKVNHIKTL